MSFASAGLELADFYPRCFGGQDLAVMVLFIVNAGHNCFDPLTLGCGDCFFKIFSAFLQLITVPLSFTIGGIALGCHRVEEVCCFFVPIRLAVCFNADEIFCCFRHSFFEDF